MSDETAVAAPAAPEQVQEGGQLVSLATVAASNVARAIGAEEKHIPAIEQALKDEIDAMSSHFAMTFADIQHGYEQEVEKVRNEAHQAYAEALTEIESEFNFIKKYIGKVLFWAFTVFSIGALIGHYAL